MTRQIRKVKYRHGTVTIVYEVLRDDEGQDKYTMECSEQPTPAFHAALRDLKGHVAVWVDQPVAWGRDLEIVGVTFTWARDVMGAVVTAIKPVECGAWCVNTPHLPAVASSDTAPCLDGACFRALEQVITQAERYIDGDRAQGRLPLDARIDPDTGEVIEPDKATGTDG